MPNHIGTSVRPVVETLTNFYFSPTEQEIPGYGFAYDPPMYLKQRFNTGVHAVLVDNPTLALALPDHGGKSSGLLYPLLPHKDDSRKKRMRILTLSNLIQKPRESCTYLLLPSAAFGLLPDEEALFALHRVAIGLEREYDKRFPFSEQQYNRCFDEPGGRQRLVSECREAFPDEDERTIGLNVIDFLVRGPHADLFMSEIKRKHGHLFVFIKLKYGQVLFTDNENVFHGRDGPGEKVKRNFSTWW